MDNKNSKEANDIESEEKENLAIATKRNVNNSIKRKLQFTDSRPVKEILKISKINTDNDWVMMLSPTSSQVHNDTVSLFTDTDLDSGSDLETNIPDRNILKNNKCHELEYVRNIVIEEHYNKSNNEIATVNTRNTHCQCKTSIKDNQKEFGAFNDVCYTYKKRGICYEPLCSFIHNLDKIKIDYVSLPFHVGKKFYILIESEKLYFLYNHMIKNFVEFFSKYNDLHMLSSVTVDIMNFAYLQEKSALLNEIVRYLQKTNVNIKCYIILVTSSKVRNDYLQKQLYQILLKIIINFPKIFDYWECLKDLFTRLNYEIDVIDLTKILDAILSNEKEKSRSVIYSFYYDIIETLPMVTITGVFSSKLISNKLMNLLEVNKMFEEVTALKLLLENMNKNKRICNETPEKDKEEESGINCKSMQKFSQKNVLEMPFPKQTSSEMSQFVDVPDFVWNSSYMFQLDQLLSNNQDKRIIKYFLDDIKNAAIERNISKVLTIFDKFKKVPIIHVFIKEFVELLFNFNDMFDYFKKFCIFATELRIIHKTNWEPIFKIIGMNLIIRLLNNSQWSDAYIIYSILKDNIFTDIFRMPIYFLPKENQRHFQRYIAIAHMLIKNNKLEDAWLILQIKTFPKNNIFLKSENLMYISYRDRIIETLLYFVGQSTSNWLLGLDIIKFIAHKKIKHLNITNYLEKIILSAIRNHCPFNYLLNLCYNDHLFTYYSNVTFRALLVYIMQCSKNKLKAVIPLYKIAVDFGVYTNLQGNEQIILLLTNQVFEEIYLIIHNFMKNLCSYFPLNNSIVIRITQVMYNKNSVPQILQSDMTNSKMLETISKIFNETFVPAIPIKIGNDFIIVSSENLNKYLEKRISSDNVIRILATAD